MEFQDDFLGADWCFFAKNLGQCQYWCNLFKNSKCDKGTQTSQTDGQTDERLTIATAKTTPTDSTVIGSGRRNHRGIIFSK